MTDQSTAQTVADTALQTLQQLAPTLISAASAGASAASPAAATIAALMPVALQLYEAHNMTKEQLTGIVSNIVSAVEANQKQIDDYAKSRGVTDPTQGAAQ